MVLLRANIVEKRVKFWQELLGVIKALTRKTASYLITMLLFLGYFLSFAVTLVLFRKKKDHAVYCAVYQKACAKQKPFR